MTPSESLHVLLDGGELDAGSERALFDALASGGELQAELHDLLAIRAAVRDDMDAFAPGAETTAAVFQQVGIQYIPQATSPTAGFLASLKKLWLPAVVTAGIMIVGGYYALRAHTDATVPAGSTQAMNAPAPTATAERPTTGATDGQATTPPTPMNTVSAGSSVIPPVESSAPQSVAPDQVPPATHATVLPRVTHRSASSAVASTDKYAVPAAASMGGDESSPVVRSPRSRTARAQATTQPATAPVSQSATNVAQASTPATAQPKPSTESSATVQSSAAPVSPATSAPSTPAAATVASPAPPAAPATAGDARASTNASVATASDSGAMVWTDDEDARKSRFPAARGSSPRRSDDINLSRAGLSLVMRTSASPIPMAATAPISSLDPAATTLGSTSVGLFWNNEDMGNVSIGVEGGLSPFPQVFQATAGGTHSQIDQHPQLFWGAVAGRYEYPIFGGRWSLFGQADLGAAQVGPMERLLGGLSYNFGGSLFGLFVGAEGAMLEYAVENSWYTSTTLGMTLGAILHF